MKYLFAISLIFSNQSIFTQSLSSTELIEKSIAYHDPQNQWNQSKFHLPIYESRPNGGYRLTDLYLDNANQTFELMQIRGKDRLYRYLSSDSCSTQWNYSTTVPSEQQKKLRLNCTGGNAWYRDYYSYLYGMPMKLKDPGTHIDQTPRTRDFFGKELLEIRVLYSAEVGQDIWYFYFDPKTYALSGYKFYHDEQKQDGEYILLDGEIVIKGVKFPQNRAWYTNKDGKYLGNDDLLPFEATRFR